MIQNINNKIIKKKREEVNNILNMEVTIKIDIKIKELKHTYKTELKGFKYVTDPTIFLSIKKIYVRYVGFNNQLYYGGFFVKAEQKNNTVFLYLINTNKQIWTIDFNNYYIFINDIISTKNEKIRKAFELYLLENENK
jgi:hypothetical protein